LTEIHNRSAIFDFFIHFSFDFLNSFRQKTNASGVKFSSPLNAELKSVTQTLRRF